ncbi:MAG TPA: TetR/AcrR family transcriptional regulator [Acidimicrobiales bacterium]|jgi:AcrR family transcriptional regulator|nr:TetR/AcrR family transcriptional regulator [Acidimicrobiales bacterium]
MGTSPDKQAHGRAAATRERILGTARSAFAAKGYDGTNLVGDVLEPAAVSAGSFYHQFRSKSDLYSAVVQEAAAGWQAPLASLAGPRDAGDLVAVARSSYRAVFDLVDQHEDLVRIQMRDRDHPDPEVCGPLRALRAGWTTTVASAYRGLVADPAAAAELTVALTLGAIALYLDTPRTKRARIRRRLVENLTTFTLGGLFALNERDGLTAPS